VKLKLSALKGGAFLHGGFLNIVPPVVGSNRLDPALKGRDCGVLSVQQNILGGSLLFCSRRWQVTSGVRMGLHCGSKEIGKPATPMATG
jgi:hypothetical protein